MKNADVQSPKEYDESTGGLLQWVQSNGIYLGLEGCLAEFDDLIEEFINDHGKRDEIGKKAKEFMDRYDEGGEEEDAGKHKSAKYYIKAMAKVVNKGQEWVQTEGERLGGILMTGNLSKQKEKWFAIRLNILSVFASVIQNDGGKTEL